MTSQKDMILGDWSSARKIQEERNNMHFSELLRLASLLVACSASAQTLPLHAVRTAAPISPTSDMHLAGASVEPMILAEWDVENDRGKIVRIVWGQEAVDQAPAGASRYEQKTYSFPTGTIRILEFKEEMGGMIHAITVESAIFMLNGSGTVEVAGELVELETGDVVSYPSGVLRGDGDATVVAWTVTGNLINEAARAQHIRSADAPVIHFAEWDENGKRVSANTPEALENAPTDAIRLSVKRYSFEGNSVRVAHSKQGGPTSQRTGKLDSLIYVTSGKLRFFQDDSIIDTVPGDAIREIAGHYHHWYRIEDSSFVAISSLPIKPLMASKP